MKNKEYHKETQAALDAFAEHCAHSVCEECKLGNINNVVYGCFGFWLNAEADIVLKPCPHCGGKAELHIDASGVFVECDECGNETPHYDDARLVVEIWNERAKAPDSPQKGERR